MVKLLRDRKVPAVILRLLFNSYTHQTLCTSWTGYLARPIQTLNGAKQGGTLSPVLFSVYFDELLCRLESQHAGCKMGRQFVGCLVYAEDVTLFLPNVNGFQKM